MLEKRVIQILEEPFLIHPKEGKNCQSFYVYTQRTQAHAYMHVFSFQSIQHLFSALEVQKWQAYNCVFVEAWKSSSKLFLGWIFPLSQNHLQSPTESDSQWVA